MLVKKGLMSLAIAMPLVSTMALAGGHYGSLDELRNRCIEFRQNAQINRFNIKILCSGSYTYWEEEVGQYALPNYSKVYTHTTCKDNRFQTEEGIFDLIMPEHVGTCSRYVKKEMRAPDGVGIAINVQNCEDLNPETVQAICKQELHTYCNDQHFVTGPEFGGYEYGGEHSSSSTSSSSSSDKGGYGQEGLCSLQVVETIDTCGMY